jgi:hypothetical protein
LDFMDLDTCTALRVANTMPTAMTVSDATTMTTTVEVDEAAPVVVAKADDFFATGVDLALDDLTDPAFTVPDVPPPPHPLFVVPVLPLLEPVLPLFVPVPPPVEPEG